MTLFKGSTHAHGVYTETMDDPLKKKVKGKAMTVATGPTLKKWTQHFIGEIGIGIVPINEENNCYWGVLDIDGEVDHVLLQTRIQEMNLPLVVCYSKSKSAHCFLFVENPIEASMMRSVLEEMASKIGFAGCEIFPKQDRLNLAQGDLGNWLNMPYFGDTRLGVLLTDGILVEQDIDSFLEYAYSKRITPESFTALTKSMSKLIDTLDNDPDLKDAPPCLQYILMTLGITDGSRNKILFNIAVFCKKKFPEETYKDKVKEIHDKYSPEPLALRELDTIIESATKKEYRYTCKDGALKQFCNSSTCIERTYGIELSHEIKTIKNAVRIMSKPEVYGVEVELEAGLPAKVYVSTEDLFAQEKFRMECSRQLFKTFMPMKNETWNKISTNIINSAINQDPPTDMSEEHTLYAALIEYLVNKLRPNIAVLAEPDGVYHDEAKHMIYFKLEDFKSYLIRKLVYGRELTAWKLGHKLNALQIPTDEVDFKLGERIKRKVIIKDDTKKAKGQAVYVRSISEEEINLAEILQSEIGDVV